jgi:hypothetical protein
MTERTGRERERERERERKGAARVSCPSVSQGKKEFFSQVKEEAY